jgi:tRNA(Ile)-lysidine synthase TilS/MesJ
MGWKSFMVNKICNAMRISLQAPSFMVMVLLGGCVAQQADLKQTEKNLQWKIKQTNEELALTRARQNQEIATLREQELPQLRDQLERAQHQAQELQQRQDDIKQRSTVLEQQMRKLEQLSTKMEAESTARYAQVRESLNAQDMKNKEDRTRIQETLDAQDVRNDVVIGRILLRIEELEKRLQALEKP